MAKIYTGSTRRIDNIVLIDGNGTGGKIPQFEYSSNILMSFSSGSSGLGLAYDPSLEYRLRLTHKDLMAEPLKTVYSQEGIWKAHNTPGYLVDKKNNQIFCFCRVAATHPGNINGNDNETWICKMDILSGNVTLVVKISDNHVDRAGRIYNVTDTEVIYGTGRNNQVEQYLSVDINTGVITTIWNTGIIGNPTPDYVYEETPDGRIIYTPQYSNGNIEIIKTNIDLQTKTTVVQIDVADLLGLSPVDIFSVNGFKLIGQLTYVGIGINVLSSGHREFKILSFDFKTGQIFEIIQGHVASLYWQRAAFFITSGLRVFVDRNNERRMTILDVNSISSGKAIRLGDNISST